MKAIILAAGFSTRLYPLTRYFPKGLLPLKDRPITDYIVADLVKQKNISEIVLVTNHRYSKLFEYWVGSSYPDRIEVIDNGVDNSEARLGAIGDIWYVVQQKNWQDEDLLILSCDTLVSMKLADMIQFFNLNRGVVNAVHDLKDLEKIRNALGNVSVENQKIVQFVEKPPTPNGSLTSVPYYIYPKEAIALLPQYLASGSSADAPGSIISWFIGKIAVYAFETRGFYYDVGTIEVYNNIAQHPELIQTM